MLKIPKNFLIENKLFFEKNMSFLKIFEHKKINKNLKFNIFGF